MGIAAPPENADAGPWRPAAGALPTSPVDAVSRFDLAMQRGVAAGLAVALAQGVAIAVLGRQLYPTWWLAVAGPLALAVTAVAIGQCIAGRLDTRARVAFTVGVAVSAILAGLAAGDAVPDVGTAMLPVVVVAVLGIGFLTSPGQAVVLGGVIIAADTLVPVLLRPDATPALLTQTAIQSLILAATTIGGRAARRTVADEERAHDQLARAVAADRAATAAQAERRELEREMHDTVLNTLAAIGRSSLPDSPAVRRRCAADAQFLRTLDTTDHATTADLRERLRSIVDTMLDDGFAAQLSFAASRSDAVPPEVSTAMVRATREALNNTREHSGASSARVDVDTTGGRLTVRVSDRGSARASRPATQRLGIRRSLAGRLEDVGGSAEVRHVPGRGTTVTMRWPR